MEIELYIRKQTYGYWEREGRLNWEMGIDMYTLYVCVCVCVCVCAKSLQSCPTLWDPMDCSPPGSSVHGILQARILEWVAMPSSRGSS